MAKLRLNLKYDAVVMSKIDTVIIDGVKFIKSDYDVESLGNKKSRVLQYFYYFIKRNVNNINYISYRQSNYKGDMIICAYLKNGEYHNVSGKAYVMTQDDKEIYGFYYLDGVRYKMYNEWIVNCRKYKLKNIMEK